MIDESEITNLTQRFGVPYRNHISMNVTPAFFYPWENKFQSRRGEVMFLLPRPGGLLLHRKAHYPPGTWRLLTGGIELGEGIEAALRREPQEEVGFTPAVRRFVALITYDIIHDEHSYPFATYIFLMAHTQQSLRPDDDEIDATRVAPLTDLPAVAETLRTLPARWQSWGNFRAHAHDVVAEQVAASELQPA